MKKYLLLVFAIASLPYFAFSQEYEVKWGNELEGFNRLLRIDNDGFYCFFSEPGKKKTISPFLVKFDNDLNRVFSNEIMVAGEKVYLQAFFALRENFAFVTSISDKEKVDYFINLINPQGQTTEAKHFFTSQINKTASNDVTVYPSEDSTHILLFNNISAIENPYKKAKPAEVFDFMVMNSEMEPVYSRNVTLSYDDSHYKTYDFLLSKNNKLVTYSVISETGSFYLPFSHEKKRGELTPQVRFVITIYGETEKDDVEFFLPQNTFMFYNNFRLRTLDDGKMYLTSLCTNDPYANPQGIVVCEINTENNSITPSYFSFPPELVQKINKSNGDSFKKKEPGIYSHDILNVHRNSKGNTILILERGIQNVSVLELENPGKMKLNILEKKQDHKNDGYSNSVRDYFVNNKLNFVYNDHSNNFNSEKIIKFSQSTGKFNVITSSLSETGLKQFKITNEGNDGFHLNTRSSRVNNNKLLLVTKKNDKYRLGLMSPKTVN